MAEHLNNNKFINPSQVYDCDAGSGLHSTVNSPGLAFHRCQLSGQFEIEIRVDYDGTPTEKLFFYLCNAKTGTSLKTFLHDHFEVPAWVEYSDPAYWNTPGGGAFTWDAVNEWWNFNGSTGNLYALGSWYVGKRWPDLKIDILDIGGTIAAFDIKDQNNVTIGNGTSPLYYCYEEQPLTFGAFDFKGIKSSYPAGHGHFRIFVNEGTAFQPTELVWVDRTSDAFWTPYPDACYDDSYYGPEGWHQDMDCGGAYGWWLDVVGTWAVGYRPKKIRLTCDAAYMTEVRVLDVHGIFIRDWTGTACAQVTLNLCGYQDDIGGIYVNGDWSVAPCALWKIEFGDARVDEDGDDAPYVVDGFGFRYMGSLDKYPFYWKITRNAANLIQCYYKEGGAGAWQNCPESFTDASILCLAFQPNNQSNFRTTKIQLYTYAMSQWVSYLTDDFWSAVTGTWTGTGWAPSGGIIRIDRKGTVFPWYQLFRPTKLKVTFTGGGTVNLTLYDFASNILYQNASYASGTEATLSWLSDDLYYLYITGSPTEVTNIEFYCEGES